METFLYIYIYYSRHLDVFYDVYIIYYFVFTMFFIDTFCLFLLLEIFSLYIRVFICHFITRFLFSASSFYSWNLVSFFFSSFLFIDLALQNISFISLHYSSYYRNFSLSFIIVIPFFLSYLFVHLPFIIEIPSSIDPLPSFFRNEMLLRYSCTLLSYITIPLLNIFPSFS